MTSSTQQLWIFDVYGFVLAGLLITMGSLGDRIGRRRLLLTGAAAFSLASLGAAYSRIAGQLIAVRAVMGIAGATLMPSTLALIRNMFHDEKQRRTAITIWTSGTMSGIGRHRVGHGRGPAGTAGAAAAVVETATEFGGAFGMVVLGSIATAAYRSGPGSSRAARHAASRAGRGRRSSARRSVLARLPGHVHGLPRNPENGNPARGREAGFAEPAA
jgi:MFS family permease